MYGINPVHDVVNHLRKDYYEKTALDVTLYSQSIQGSHIR